LEETISSNGEHGHLYLYHQFATPETFGAVMIALEGSEYQKWDQVGHKPSHGALESTLSAISRMESHP
jgi:hypothetical protein